MLRALVAGENLEFFPEGSRSRSGKPCCPKAGLLSVVVDAVKEGEWGVVLGVWSSAGVCVQV